jgi:hypothetical protein
VTYSPVVVPPNLFVPADVAQSLIPQGSRPPQRVTISGYSYKLSALSVPRPPLANTIKMIINWLGPAGRLAKNITYGLFGTAVDTTVTATLQAAANALMNAIGSTALRSQLHSSWTINSVTAKDNSGNSENAVDSSVAALPCTGAGNPMAPGNAVCISWTINASYRGGKPRWYLPGIMLSAQNTVGDSQLTTVFANSIKTAANGIQTSFNASSPNGHDVILGTISYFTGHALRPTPLFRPFGVAKVHERMDSQRRRNGKENLFPSV